MNKTKPIALLDTDVASYMFKGNAIAWEYLALLRGYDLAISFVTAAELWFGAEKHGWGARRRLQLGRFLQESSILPFQEGMEHVYAKIMAHREHAGNRMEKSDGWIATTAIHYGLPLAVHDSDFLGTPGLRIITASAAVRAAQARLPTVSGRPLDLNATCRCSL